MMQNGNSEPKSVDFVGELEPGKLFLDMAARRIEDRFAALNDNDDAATVKAADAALARW